jgi:hypothetical protein
MISRWDAKKNLNCMPISSTWDGRREALALSCRRWRPTEGSEKLRRVGASVPAHTMSRRASVEVAHPIAATSRRCGRALAGLPPVSSVLPPPIAAASRSQGAPGAPGPPQPGPRPAHRKSVWRGPYLCLGSRRRRPLGILSNRRWRRPASETPPDP